MTVATPLWASVHDLQVKFQADEEVAVGALEFASFVLWSLSGRMYAPETVTREAYDTSQTLAYGAQVYPVFLGGSPYNISSCSDCPCSMCGVFHRTRLRGYPVRRIYRVWVNGVELHPSEWVLLDNAVLGLRGASSCNAQCITVEYVYGSGVPAGGKIAVVKLAEQLLLSYKGAPCELPARVTSVTRQGMSFTLLDPQDFLNKGRTGIYEIDLMLSALNPAGALKRARVFSPDIRRAEVQSPSLVAPPRYVVLHDKDQLITPGFDSMWDGKFQHPHELVTTLDDGRVLPYKWTTTESGKSRLVVDAAGSWTIPDGMGYTVTRGDNVVLTGKVQVL